jgi:hypothetical protein
VFISLHSAAAFSASLTVTIRQLNPDSAVQQVTCVDHQKCVLPLVINAGQPTTQSLNINIEYIPGDLLLEFQAPKGYFYADDTVDTIGFYNTIWSKAVPGDKPATYDVTLFQPLVPHMEALILSVAHEASLNIAHAAVANLEITTQPVP